MVRKKRGRENKEMHQEAKEKKCWRWSGNQNSRNKRKIGALFLDFDRNRTVPGGGRKERVPRGKRGGRATTEGKNMQ